MAKTVWIVVTALLCLGLAYWCYVPQPVGTEISTYCYFAITQILGIPIAITSLVKKRQAVLLIRNVIAGLTYFNTIKAHPLIEDTYFDGIPVRVFGRQSPPGVVHPAIVHFHGGGWISGNIDMAHPFLLEVWNETNAVIVSVDYRLAPEHVFPAAIEDARRAALYLVRNAARFHVDPHRVSVAGESSGANIAAAVALWWRDEKITPALSHQILGCPPLQATDFHTTSFREFGHSCSFGMPARETIGGIWLTYLLREWTHQDLNDITSNKHVDQKTWNKYLSQYGEEVNAGPYVAEEINPELVERLRDKITDPYAAPLFADSLRDLPTCLILYGHRDSLRTDAELYARRLRQDGVNVTSVSHKNSGHCDYVKGIKDMGFLRTSLALQTLKEYLNYINKNL